MKSLPANVTMEEVETFIEKNGMDIGVRENNATSVLFKIVEIHQEQIKELSRKLEDIKGES